MAGQINDFVAPVTAETHKFTHDCEFTGEEFPGLITKAGFRNLLEAHIRSLNKAKQVSYTRNQEWLDAIRHGSDIPPSGYAGSQASWRNEIGATNPTTSKWIVEGDRVYKKSGSAKESGAMTPTERIYELMTSVHQAHGHKGRDNFYKLVQKYSGSIKKAFCGQFVQVCCEKAELWEAGGTVKYDFKPEVKRKAARGSNSAAATLAATVAEKFDDNPVVDKRIVDEVDADLQRILEEILATEANNFGPEVVDGSFNPEPRNAQNAVLDPQIFAMALNNHGQNNAGIFQQSRPVQEVQMDHPQKMNIDQYEFDQYNFDQQYFPGQESNASAYSPAIAYHPGQMQPSYFLSNNEMIADQADHNMFIGNVKIGLENPIMYDNYELDYNPPDWQPLPIAADHQAIQPAQDGPEIPSYDMDFSGLDDNGSYAFNMMEAEDPEIPF